MSPDEASAGRGPEIHVVSPELHRRGGTERALSEKLVRWSRECRIRVFTTRFELEGGEDLTVHELPRLPGPALFRFPFWVAMNHLVRLLLPAGEERPLLYSPGINCLDADVIGVHMTFAKYRRAMRAVRRDEDRTSESILRRLHRRLYRALVERLERRVYTGPATLWAPSAAEARFLEEEYGRPRGSVEVIPHGVDAEAFSPSRRTERRLAARKELGLENERVVLLLSNDVRKKGVDTAVRALRELPEDVVLAAAGRFDRGPVRNLARRIGVEERFRCWPHRNDVFPYYAAADLLVAPSREDSFNLPALEALSCGLPAVVSREAGVAELLEDGRSALLFDDPEDPETLAAAITGVLNDADLRRRLGKEGRAVAEANGWDSHAARVVGLVERELSRPRFLVLATDAFERGGVGRCTRTLLEALGESYGRDRVGLLSVWGSDADALPSVRWLERDAPEGPGPVRLARRISFSLKALREARRWRRNLVIVANHPHLAPLAQIAAAVSGAPFAVWAHGFEAWCPERRSVRGSMARADQVWTVSRFTADRMEENGVVPPGRIRVLRHAVPSEMELTARQAVGQEPVVLTVARLTRDHAYKGVDTLIEVWPEVTATVPDARLEVVGDGDDRGRLEAMAVERDVDGDVRFRGHVSDAELEDAYGRARLFALPGRTEGGDDPRGEGFGLVFLEAAAAGLPVVAGRAAGSVEAVEHGETGFLVDPEDPSDVARRVIRLLRDEELARTMGRAGRARVEEEFSFDAFRENVETLVGELPWGQQ